MIKKEKENEIMVTAGVAEDLGLKVGDVLTVKFAETQDSLLFLNKKGEGTKPSPLRL